MYVRVRPLNDAERERGAAWRVEGNGILQVDPAGGEPRSDTPYKLDAVFDGSQPTAAVYEATTQGLIHQVVNGFNSTVFAYGQASCTRAGRANQGARPCQHMQVENAAACQALDSCFPDGGRGQGLTTSLCCCWVLADLLWQDTHHEGHCG